VRRRRENFANSPLYKAVLPSKINGVECAAGAKKLQNHTSTTRIYLLKPAILSAPQARKFYKSHLYKADLPSKINDIECAAGRENFAKSSLYNADLPSKINDIECAAGAKILRKNSWSRISRPTRTAAVRFFLAPRTALKRSGPGWSG